MRKIYLIAGASLALACSSEPNAPLSMNSFGGTTSAGASGAASASPQGGSGATSSGGTTSSGGGQSPSSGGMSGTGAAIATAGASGGAVSHESGGAASTQTGGSSGADQIGGNPASGATTSTGGAQALAGGGVGGTPGANGGAAGASAGIANGGNGESGSASVAKALDGLRIDDGCAGTPDTTDGAVCTHTMLTNNQFRASKEVTITGTEGVTYDVTLRVRGVVEPASVNGGTRPDTSTFSYKNAMWRTVPYTIGGTVTAPDYEQWHVRVASPQQDYYLNDYQKNGHFVFKLDYQVTIPMAANTKVTFDCYDSNEREIVNYESYAVDGISGSVNHGQFVQLDVISVKAR
jgi:hypothetical protein